MTSAAATPIKLASHALILSSITTDSRDVYGGRTGEARDTTRTKIGNIGIYLRVYAYSLHVFIIELCLYIHL